jgi:hypothetical protein
MVRYGMVWYGMVWYGMVWYGVIWYGMVWYGMVWYGIGTNAPRNPSIYLDLFCLLVLSNCKYSRLGSRPEERSNLVNSRCRISMTALVPCFTESVMVYTAEWRPWTSTPRVASGSGYNM